MYKYTAQGNFKVKETFASSLKANNEACTSNNECKSLYCNKAKKCSDVPVGNSCNSNFDCVTGYCFRNQCALKTLGKSCDAAYQCQSKKCSTKCLD